MKKTHLLFPLLFLLFFSINKTSTQALKDKFYIGTFNFIVYPGIYNDVTRFGQLSFNMMQGYGFHNDIDSSYLDGGFYDGVSSYSLNINSMLTAWDTYSGENSMVFDREKLLRPAYGKRCDYQAEYLPSQITNGDIRPAYGYETSGGSTYQEEWQGEIVSGRNTGLPSNATPYYLVKNLYENYQQICTPQRGGTGNAHDLIYYLSDRKQAPYYYFIKPRMRVDSVFAKNNPNLPVVAIITKNYLGQTIDSTVLTCLNFIDLNGYYNGRYLEQFYRLVPSTKLSVDADSLLRGTDENLDWMSQSNWPPLIDYRVYWFGQVNVWLDYVRVDDEWAHYLFNPQLDVTHKYDFKLKIAEEIELLSSHPSGFGYAYMDEFQYSSIPCIKEVNRIIDSLAPGLHTSVIPLINDNYYGPGQSLRHPPVYSDGYNYLLTGGAVKDILMTDIYPIENTYPLPPNVTPPKKSEYPGTKFYRKTSTRNLYNDTLNLLLELGDYPYHYYNNYHAPSYMDRYRKCAGIVKATQNTASPVIFSLAIQSHSFEALLAENDWQISSREPLNEEISLQCYLGLLYGARHILHYWYPSIKNTSDNGNYYDWGLVDTGLGFIYKRDTNYYGQRKWEFIQHLDSTLMKTGNYMYLQNKLKWDTAATVNTFPVTTRPHLPMRYINDVLSRAPLLSGTNSDCFNDFPNDYYDCPEKKFWEFGFFLPESPATDYSRYFIALNKRCTPNLSNDGDLRELRIKFQASELPVYNNWKLIDAITKTTIITFSKNSGSYVVAGTFQPGEGKLFKLEPALKSGGTLVADENIEGVNFTCEDTVFSNGHNITIGANTTIHFTDTSAIVMDSGSFTMGNSQVSGSQSITSDAVTGNIWRGYSFNNCEVRIYGAAFGGLANDTTYAINIIDCPVVDIRNSTFNTNASLKGGINGVYYSTSTIDNIYIGGNTFSSSGSTLPQVQVMSYAGITTPLIIENNTFNYGNTAILLSGVTGGAIKDNNITDYNIAINLLTSSVDISENTIVSSMSNSIGIFGAAGSEIKMNNSGAQMLGGMNDVSNTGNYANNMKVDNSYFLIDRGENIFNINETSAFHLSGFFNPFVSATTDATQNCFKFNTSPVDPPYNNVTWGDQGPTVSFTFSPYLTGCTPADCEAPIVLDLGDGIYDTICGGGMGSGGGESSIKNYELGITNSKNHIRGGSLIPNSKNHIPLPGGVSEGQGGLVIPNPKQSNIPLSGGVSEGRGGFVILTPKQMYDSLSILMRHRNYPQAKIKCYDILNTYPDSLQSIYAISKLFLATIGSDTTTNTAQQLKTYYEGLILNHPNNTALVTRSNYFIQKCKVRLREYNSALTGFSHIINQNPYSYEALVARWDYMAASLLIQGSGGSESSIKNYELGITNSDQSEESDEFDKSDELWGDKSPYTKEQSQDIRRSINTALENTGRSDERKMKILEESSSLGDVNASVELSQRKTIKEVAKTERPRNIIEHVLIVAGDIRKVFGVNTSGKDGKSGKIPLVFRLSQNYPNPFNPTTKISYDLPRDSKVNIVIYDILGREVKRLLNNEIKSAGSYIVDFNAPNYASGVYFYRIEAEESNGNKFVDSKKMVLVK